MSAPGLIATIAGSIGKRKAKKGLERELRNAPKYQINEEAFENQAMAKADAFGRDRSIQMQEENIAQGTADAAAEARDITSSSSGLLNTIAKLQAAKNSALRGLSQDEAGFQNQKRQQLLNVNNQVIDEKDKAWNFNVNMPFQMRVGMYRDQRKASEEMEMAGVAAQAQTESAFISSFGSMMGAASDERLKENVKGYTVGLGAVMEMRPVTFEYVPGSRYNDGKYHVGFIAQEIEQIIPEAVSPIYGETDMKMIHYNELIPVLVNAIQEQQKKIDAMSLALKMAGITKWVAEES